MEVGDFQGISAGISVIFHSGIFGDENANKWQMLPFCKLVIFPIAGGGSELVPRARDLFICHIDSRVADIVNPSAVLHGLRPRIRSGWSCSR